ncbi:MAG: hypothetical protein ACQESR_11445 [Planctomycetota bacterium]
MESGPAQAVLPLVGLAARKVIRDRYERTERGAITSAPIWRSPFLHPSPIGSFWGEFHPRNDGSRHAMSKWKTRSAAKKTW